MAYATMACAAWHEADPSSIPAPIIQKMANVGQPQAEVSKNQYYISYLTKILTAFACEGERNLSVTHVINYFLTISSFPAS